MHEPIWRKLRRIFSDKTFLDFISRFDNGLAKVLALAMIGVIVVAVIDLFHLLITAIFISPSGNFSITLIEIFGLFLNILIALEILENVTANIHKHAILELVVATALTAVARKIIIFDAKSAKVNLGELAIAVIALTLSYWIIRQANRSS